MSSLSDIKIFSDGSVEISPPPIETGRKRVHPHRLAIIRQNYDPTNLERDFDPQVSPTQDTPADLDKKGHTIQVNDSWFWHASRIMTTSAYRWWRKPFMQMFNRHHRLDGCVVKVPKDKDEPRMENIGLPGNFASLDKFAPHHARIVCKNSLYAPSDMTVAKDNWYNKPTEWWMSTMVNEFGDVLLVGNGDYVFTPVVKRQPERWIPLEHIELFPGLPFFVEYEGRVEYVTGYCVQDGTDIYGHAETRDIPLRLVVNRVATHPCVGWALESKPVIPLE